MAKSMKLGGGGRFQKGVQDMVQEKGYSKGKASAIMAAAGRKKYGKKKFQAMSAKGKNDAENPKEAAAKNEEGDAKKRKKRKMTTTENAVYLAMTGKGKK